VAAVGTSLFFASDAIAQILKARGSSYGYFGISGLASVWAWVQQASPLLLLVRTSMPVAAAICIVLPGPRARVAVLPLCVLLAGLALVLPRVDDALRARYTFWVGGMDDEQLATFLCFALAGLAVLAISLRDAARNGCSVPVHAPPLLVERDPSEKEA